VITTRLQVLQGQRETPIAAALPTFLLAAVRNPQRIGAISPSSSRLAALMASVVPTVGEPVVIELGPGTGAVSSAIAARLPEGGRHLAVELDPAMAAFLRHHQVGVEMINADALDLSDLLAAREIPKVTAVVSGLPWSLFDSDSQEHILRQIAEAIGTDGVFTTFAYAHARPLSSARRFRRALERAFDEVQISRLVWRNMPPAFIYICRRPRLVGPGGRSDFRNS
jgi:phospholipid N-methyltransferase